MLNTDYLSYIQCSLPYMKHIFHFYNHNIAFNCYKYILLQIDGYMLYHNYGIFHNYFQCKCQHTNNLNWNSIIENFVCMINTVLNFHYIHNNYRCKVDRLTIRHQNKIQFCIFRIPVIFF